MSGEDAAWKDELRAFLDERAAAGAFSGHALVWRDGGPVFSYVGGIAHRGHGVPVDERTRFGVASIGKFATGIAALRLVDRGVVRLDQPLIEVLPAEHRPKALTHVHTLHHLLSHTSGLPNYYDDSDDDSWNSWDEIWRRTPTYTIRRPADLLPLFADLPAVAEPGVEVRYNDAAFVLVGLVIEAVTGRPWDEVLADEVIGPAGMTDTGTEAVDDDPPRLAVGYVTDDGPPDKRKTNTYGLTAAPMPDGGMITTPVDLARLMDALLAERLLGPELVAAMTRPQGPSSTEIEQWGYGCKLTVADGRIVAIGHTGSDPGVAAFLSHYLAEQTTVVVLLNQDRGAFAASMRIAAGLGIDDPRAALLPA